MAVRVGTEVWHARQDTYAPLADDGCWPFGRQEFLAMTSHSRREACSIWLPVPQQYAWNDWLAAM
jgi:hypothetical protein